MRDINRIRPFLDKVAEVWERYPDLRFGQFVIDVVPDSDRLWNCEEDGNYITEEELEIGKEYTLVPHGGRHDGMFVHIKEHPCRSGYPYYLFEELTPYDEEIGKKLLWTS